MTHAHTSPPPSTGNPHSATVLLHEDAPPLPTSLDARLSGKRAGVPKPDDGYANDDYSLNYNHSHQALGLKPSVNPTYEFVEQDDQKVNFVSNSRVGFGSPVKPVELVLAILHNYAKLLGLENDEYLLSFFAKFSKGVILSKSQKNQMTMLTSYAANFTPDTEATAVFNTLQYLQEGGHGRETKHIKQHMVSRFSHMKQFIQSGRHNYVVGTDCVHLEGQEVLRTDCFGYITYLGKHFQRLGFHLDPDMQRENAKNLLPFAYERCKAAAKKQHNHTDLGSLAAGLHQAVCAAATLLPVNAAGDSTTTVTQAVRHLPSSDYRKLHSMLGDEIYLRTFHKVINGYDDTIRNIEGMSVGNAVQVQHGTHLLRNGRPDDTKCADAGLVEVVHKQLCAVKEMKPPKGEHVLVVGAGSHNLTQYDLAKCLPGVQLDLTDLQSGHADVKKGVNATESGVYHGYKYALSDVGTSKGETRDSMDKSMAVLTAMLEGGVAVGAVKMHLQVLWRHAEDFATLSQTAKLSVYDIARYHNGEMMVHFDTSSSAPFPEYAFKSVLKILFVSAAKFSYWRTVCDLSGILLPKPKRAYDCYDFLGGMKVKQRLAPVAAAYPVKFRETNPYKNFDDEAGQFGIPNDADAQAELEFE